MIEGIQFLFKQYKDYHKALRTPALAPVAPALAPAAPGPAAPAAAPAAAARGPRPFKKYMPPNKYNHRKFTPNGNDGGNGGGDGGGGGDGDGGNQPTARRKAK
ncbi:hypothetical protein BGZ79_005894, partial [Entomortierella chlamydospora]